MKPHSAKDLARTLITKGLEDERALQKFAHDPEIADRIVGFHAQQAAEKYMKSVLTASEVRYERTHNLATLIELLRESGTHTPEWLDDTVPLTPYAVGLRYEEEDTEPLDRMTTVALVEQTRLWAEEQVDQA